MLSAAGNKEIRNRDAIDDVYIKRFIESLRNFDKTRHLKIPEPVYKDLNNISAMPRVTSFEKYARMLRSLNDFRSHLEPQQNKNAIAIEIFLIGEVSRQIEAKWEESKNKEDGEDTLRLDCCINGIVESAERYTSAKHQQFGEKWHVLERPEECKLWHAFTETLKNDFDKEYYLRELTRLLIVLNLSKDSKLTDRNDGMEDRNPADAEKKRTALNKEKYIWTFKNLVTLFLDYLSAYAASQNGRPDNLVNFSNKVEKLRDLLSRFKEDFFKVVTYEIFKRKNFDETSEFTRFEDTVHQIRMDIAFDKTRMAQKKNPQKQEKDRLLFLRYANHPKIKTINGILSTEKDANVVEYYTFKALVFCKKLYEQERGYSSLIAVSGNEIARCSQEMDKLNTKIELCSFKAENDWRLCEELMAKLNLPLDQIQRQRQLAQDLKQVPEKRQALHALMDEFGISGHAPNAIPLETIDDERRMSFFKRLKEICGANTVEEAIRILDRKQRNCEEDIKTFYNVLGVDRIPIWTRYLKVMQEREATLQLIEELRAKVGTLREQYNAAMTQFQQTCDEYESFKEENQLQSDIDTFDQSHPKDLAVTKVAQPPIEEGTGLRKRRTRFNSVVLNVDEFPFIRESHAEQTSNRKEPILLQTTVVNNEARFNWKTAAAIVGGVVLFSTVSIALVYFTCGLALPFLVLAGLGGGLFGGGMGFGVKKLFDRCTERKQVTQDEDIGKCDRHSVKSFFGSRANMQQKLSAFVDSVRPSRTPATAAMEMQPYPSKQRFSVGDSGFYRKPSDAGQGGNLDPSYKLKRV